MEKDKQKEITCICCGDKPEYACTCGAFLCKDCGDNGDSCCFEEEHELESLKTIINNNK